jgi:hypothetical protein
MGIVTGCQSTRDHPEKAISEDRLSSSIVASTSGTAALDSSVFINIDRVAKAPHRYTTRNVVAISSQLDTSLVTPRATFRYDMPHKPDIKSSSTCSHT